MNKLSINFSRHSKDDISW